jgi:hypothetical protein
MNRTQEEMLGQSVYLRLLLRLRGSELEKSRGISDGRMRSTISP